MFKKPTLRFPSLGNVIKTCLFIVMILVLMSCSEAHRFEDFTFAGSGKTAAIFSQDSKACEAEKEVNKLTIVKFLNRLWPSNEHS